ncbi:MAG: sugar ABC transporter permease [Anaerolineae bacterium]|nr:sugar ABC transporter permease [Anaerolineae bacterium]
MTTIDSALRRAAPPSPPQMPIVVYASVVANIIIAVVCVLLAISIFNLQEGTADSSTAVQQLLRLGRPVVVFVGLIVLTPALIAVFSSIQLLRRNISGRYAALVLQGLGLVFSVVALIHLWGFFNSFETIVDGIVQNPWLLLGIPIAYALFWLGGRFSKTTSWGSRLETAGILLGMATLIVVLFVANILTFANNILSAYSNPATWIATVLAFVFGFLAWRLLHLGQFFRETQDQLVAWQGWLMLSPNIIGFMIFFAGPLLLSFYLSFTNNTVGRVPDFIGVQNYTDILSLELKWLDDPQAAPQSVMTFGFSPLGEINLGGRVLVIGAKDALFWISLRNTILFCLLLVPLSVLPALGLAMVLNSKLPGVNFFRAVYFLPSVAAVVGTALIWRWLYDPTIGFINYGISQLVNFLNSIGFQLADPQIEWLTGPGVVLLSIVILSAWQVIGFNTVLFLAGLQGISRELYEASSIDGANRWETFLFITLPMLAPTTFFVIITTVITGLQVFNEPYALFPSRPIPENATTSVFYLYREGFFSFNFGYASAIAWVLFALIFLMTLAQFRLQRSNAYEG